MKTSLLVILLLFSVTNNQAQIKWHKYIDNPVLEKGEAGEWDGENVGLPVVLWDGTKYNMWYSGNDEDAFAIGYATSTDGINWIKYANNPVLEKGAPGEWDAGNIEPSSVIFNGSHYMMYYNGSGMTGLAISLDGISWTKDTLNNPVLVPGETGSWDEDLAVYPHVIYENSIYKLWYAGNAWYENLEMWTWKIGYAESNDGIDWTKRTEPVLEDGDFETWANDLLAPCLIFEDNIYTMWYFSANTFTSSDPQFNCATSTDGISWVKYGDNPILKLGTSGEWDDGFIFKPLVIKENNLYKMWFDGNDGTGDWAIGYAEDFSNLVHADSVIVDELYYAPNQDPINILGRVLSPDGHALTAKAMLLRDDGSIQDSVEIFDDGLNDDGAAGDGIYGGYIPVTTEDNFTVGIKTEDQVTGFTRNGLNWNITNRFTTKGPIVLENFEIISHDTVHPGDRARIDLTLRNDGVSDTVYGVNKVYLIIPEGSCARETTTGTPKFGDIAPGESVTGTRAYAISFADSCMPGLFEFGIEITSNNVVWWYDTFTIELFEDPTDVEDESLSLPKEFALEQNYPNPFNPSTTIKYEIPGQTRNDNLHVTLKVYDILGKEVATLVNEQKQPGYYEVNFNATALSSGVYFYKIKTGSFISTKKMILLR